jgi:hypothetical protein
VVDVSPPVIAMWAHPRAVSTAFLRMMIARGDLTVVHEPWVTLIDEGYVELPTTDGGSVTVRGPGEVLTHLVKLGEHQPVFVKDTAEYSYRPLFDHTDELAAMTHTFIVREPARTIASHYAVKSTVTCPEIGYEHQCELFEFVWRLTGRKPVVISAERLLAAPETVIEAYCSAVGLPYLPQALRWEPGARAEWRRTQKWHVAASASSGFQSAERAYEVTVDNHPGLRSYYEHHRPFYERLIQHAIPGESS